MSAELLELDATGTRVRRGAGALTWPGVTLALMFRFCIYDVLRQRLFAEMHGSSAVSSGLLLADGTGERGCVYRLAPRALLSADGTGLPARALLFAR